MSNKKVTIRISQETIKYLRILKAELGLPTLDDAIKYLIKGKKGNK